MADQPRLLRVFLSSPGDVPEERKIASGVLDALQYDTALRGKVAIQIVAWDQPGSDTPLLANMTPQEAINQGMPVPADCDVVVVIFWSRMGTPLPPEYTKPNGERYMSGTEWEFTNAVEAANEAAKKGEGLARPRVVMYRRTDRINLDPEDANFEAKTEQWRRVRNFFNGFVNSDGSLRQGYNAYESPEQFRVKFEEHIKKLIGQLIDIPGFGKPSTGVPLKLWKGSPFPGLRSFTPDDEPIFYGRGAETDDLVERLRNQRFVAVVGASGSGKSSLVAAGLIPRLSANAIDGSKDWILPSTTGDLDDRVWVGARFTPGENANPFYPLASRLAEALKRDPAELAAAMETQPDTIEAIFDPLFEGRPDWAEMLIYIDQFEELLTLADKSKIDSFVRMLQAISVSKRLRVVITLRADFYARCVEILELSELLKHSTFPLSAPGAAALYEMVAKPADRAGLSFEAGLVDQILRDTGTDAGALALLAYLLDELYRKSITGNQSLLTIAQYDALGGVQGAIGKRAEEVVDVLPQEEQAALPKLFSEIVEVDARGRGTRRRAVMDRLDADPAIHHIVEVLTSARLLVSYEDDEKRSVIEVAHEALVREWDRLATWIVSAQADLLLRRQLEQAARDWNNAISDKESYGLVGDRLLEAQRWRLHSTLDAQVGDYIDASERYDQARKAAEDERKDALERAETSSKHAAQLAKIQEDRARQRTRIAAVIGVIAVVIIVGAVVALLLARNEVTNANVQLNGASTTVAGANATLTPIPVTLTQAAQTLVANGAIGESERLAAQAQAILGDQTKDNLPAVLLSIRALEKAYSAQADAALVQALSSTFEQRELVGHTARINNAAYSPDGRYILTSSEDGTARLWDSASGALLRTFTDTIAPQRLATATALSNSSNNSVTVAHASPAFSDAIFSPDGRQIATVDNYNQIQFWDVTNGNPEQVMEVGSLSVTSNLAFSADGRYLLAGCNDNQLRLWDVSTKSIIRVYGTADLNNYVTRVAFSHDGKRIVSLSTDQSIRIWDIASEQNSWVYNNPEGNSSASLNISSFALSPNDRRLALGKANGDVNMLDINSGEIVATFSGHNDVVNNLHFTADGLYLITASEDSTALLWNVANGRILQSFVGAANGLSTALLSPDSMQVFSAGTDGLGRLYSSGLGPQIDTYTGHSDAIIGASFSADRNEVMTVGQDGLILIHDTFSGTILRTIRDTGFAVSAAAFNPDGRYVVVAGTSVSDNAGVLQVWDTATATLLRSLPNPDKYPLDSLAVSPDGRYLLAGDDNLTATLWDLPIGEAIRTYIIPTQGSAAAPVGAINAMAFSPDGRYIVTAITYATITSDSAGQNAIDLWDTNTQQLLRTFIPKDSQGKPETDNAGNPIYGQINSLAFSPDGRYILSGGSGLVEPSTDRVATLFLWDTASGDEVRELNGHSDAVTSVAFSPDGQYALSGSKDRTARLWNLATGQVQRTFSGHTDAVTDVDFSADGSFFLTASADRTAHLWDVDYRHFIEFACSQVWRDFTPQERVAFGIFDSVPTCPQFASTYHPFTMALPTESTFPLLKTTPIESPTAGITPIGTSDYQVYPTATYPGALLTFTPSSTPTQGASPTQTASATPDTPTDTNTDTATAVHPTATLVIVGNAAGWTALPRFTPSATLTPSDTSTASNTPIPTDTPSITPTTSAIVPTISPTPTVQIIGTIPNWTPLPVLTLDNPTLVPVQPSVTQAPSATTVPSSPTIVLSPVNALPDWTPLPSATPGAP